ncbi:MAG: winged helix-turn-helix domain-containing protein [Burkholderiaceae bacterium]|nr:winged helix-turn-helix domain-containing protein [Burkholderiaceae bacterium]
MKQKSIPIVLREFTEGPRPSGNTQGKDTFRKLSDFIDSHPSATIFSVSFAGIEATDASFARESIVSVAKRYRGQKGFFLLDLTNRDIIFNWECAASAVEQPLVIWRDHEFEVIGPKLSSSTATLLNYVLKKETTSASQISNDLDMSVQNASTRLKKLVELGYIMRSEVIAESGGIEFTYNAIK